MAGDFTPATLESCILWKRLNEPFKTDPENTLAKALAHSVGEVCKLARERMKLMPAVHPEFTLHDETHLLRVTELMARVIPEKVLREVLNPVEIALLILSAHFHDTGMVPDSGEANAIRESKEFSLARDNWLVEFAGFRDATLVLNDKEADPIDKVRCEEVVAEHEQAIFQRFLRDTHAERSADFVKTRLNTDQRLRVGTGHLADALALLCVSHNWPPDQISDGNGFLPDKAVGTFPANLQYLACVLRLADILDFDRERTPDELFRCVTFTNQVSITEWEKHRSVEGWKVDRDAVRFECACERPEYERAIHRFLGYIDDELTAAHGIARRFPSQFSAYYFDLPFRTDRSRVTPKDGAYLQATDLEIALSRDEIVRLLMTEKLYGQPSLAIRELLQNAWDALRHRVAIMKRDEEMDWTHGHVEFEHGVNVEGREYVRCTDNGVGMDQHILKNFLVRAGRSYYRSPEFERERIAFRQKGADFDPCARFGIGFMSVFMLGDQITIWTRRYRGLQGGLGEPLIVEINGIGGLIVLREGKADQAPGTKIEIVGRRKPDRFLSHHDRVRLVDTIYAFALAGEFPVHARCTIPEVADEISLPAGVAKAWHPLVEYGVKGCAAFTQAFSEIDSRLGGAIVCAVPLTEDGRLVVANEEGGWKIGEKNMGPAYWVEGAKKVSTWTWEGRTCLDGILVAGPHGRGRRGFPLVSTQYRNPVHFGEDPFVLDVRGELKPELTPHRSPPDRQGVLNDAGPTWRRLRNMAARAHGKLWEQVITRFESPADIKALWQLLALHRVSFATLRRGFVWERMLVPSLTPAGDLHFRQFSALAPIPFGVGAQKPFAAERDGTIVGIDAEMGAWKTSNNGGMVANIIEEAICGLAILTLDKNGPELIFQPPLDPEELNFSSIVFSDFDRTFSTMPFGRGFEGVLVAQACECLLNRRHPLVEWLLRHQGSTLGNPNFDFLHCLAGALLEEGALEALAVGNFKSSRHNWHFSLLGYRFRLADFDSLEKALRPPYICWHPDHGKFEISKETLEKLAEVQAIDWRRNKEERYI